VRRRVKRLRAALGPAAHISVAACDLDKTLYPPAGPQRAKQLCDNVKAVKAFERLGGFVFPVTGNNPPQAQVKFLDSAGRPLRHVSEHPGIFCNGGLVLGPRGVEIERHALGTLQMEGSAWDGAPPTDFVTALLAWWDAPAQATVTRGGQVHPTTPPTKHTHVITGDLVSSPHEIPSHLIASHRIASHPIPCPMCHVAGGAALLPPE
jgi:hypothetical protein